MKKFLICLMVLPAMLLAGCSMDSKNPDYYGEWKSKNDSYLVELEQTYASGSEPYTKIVPEWASDACVFMKWHNDRSLTAGNLSPLSTSTVNIKYEMEDIEGTQLGDSYSNVEHGDSIYQSNPNQNIVGMWAAMLNMHVGDSVTMVIPYTSGYGARAVGSIRPYTNLIYHVKMTGIPAFERQ